MTVEAGYLTVADLLERGWTKTLIKKHLGLPDRLFPVNHWKNWSGKKAWQIQTVELAEMTQGFEASFLPGARIRKLPKGQLEVVIDRVYNLREGRAATPDEIRTDAESRLRMASHSDADWIAEASRRGYRTPHKC